MPLETDPAPNRQVGLGVVGVRLEHRPSVLHLLPRYGQFANLFAAVVGLFAELAASALLGQTIGGFGDLQADVVPIFGEGLVDHRIGGLNERPHLLRFESA